MQNKRDTIIYRVVTGLFTVYMVFTVIAYFAMHDMVADMFTSLGVPPEIIYPLAIIKLVGLAVIGWNKYRTLKELAYVGFALDFILAASMHLVQNDGGFIAPLFALGLATVSFIYHRKLYV